MHDLNDPALTQRLQHKLDNKTKPLGSLGRIEALKLHHGTLNAVILPHALRMLEETGAASDKFVRIRRAIRLPESASVADAIAALNASIGIAPSLGALGVTPAHWPESKPYALSDMASFTNAAPFKDAEYDQLFTRSLG